MSKPDGNDKLVSNNGLAWLLVTLAAVVILTLTLPFPVSFIVSLLVIISLNVIRADIALKKAGMGGIRSWYKSYSSLSSSRGWDRNVKDSLYKPIKFSCMSCGNEHNKVECPKCGSKAVRAG
jgi:hypothetical protein